jgi:hypothetical protein
MARPLKEGLDYFPLDVQMDEKIEMIESVYGLPGFALYIKILQECYKKENGKIQININSKFSVWKILGKRIGIPTDNIKEMVIEMIELNLFDKKEYENGFITSNGIQKRMAEVNKYRKKDRERKENNYPSGKLSENSRKTGERKRKRKEKENTYDFETVWLLYPKKDGKKEALKHFNASVKTEDNYQDIIKAIDNYINHIKKNKIEPRYIKNGSTFFNNWQDWINPNGTDKKTIELKRDIPEGAA